MKHGGSPTYQRPSYPRLRSSAEPIRVARGKTGGTLDSVLCCDCTCHPQSSKPPASSKHTDPPAAAHHHPLALRKTRHPQLSIHALELHSPSQHRGPLPYALRQTRTLHYRGPISVRIMPAPGLRTATILDMARADERVHKSA
ncbi:hypothetical protein VTO73DRAFT_14218 [Trametes versicolor]